MVGLVFLLPLSAHLILHLPYPDRSFGVLPLVVFCRAPPSKLTGQVVGQVLFLPSSPSSSLPKVVGLIFLLPQFPAICIPQVDGMISVERGLLGTPPTVLCPGSCAPILEA